MIDYKKLIMTTMLELPEIKKKKSKTAYKRSESVRDLERMADKAARIKFPNHPEGVLAPRRYRDDSANSLTCCITTYIQLMGGFASRISNQGTFSRKLNRYIPGTSKKGLADIMATFRGLSLQ